MWHSFRAQSGKASTTLGPRSLVLVLLGGEAGLRRGEICGLRWDDFDLCAGVLTAHDDGTGVGRSRITLLFGCVDA